MIATDLKSILLVDDDSTTNFLNKIFIDRLDLDIGVDIALNGKDALDIINVNMADPDFGHCLIVLDLNMPIMDGWAFLEYCNESLERKIRDKISIVVLTTMEIDPVMAKNLNDLNVKDFVQKPLSDDSFDKLINKYLVD